MASTWRFCVASISGVLPSCHPHRESSVDICIIIIILLLPVYALKTTFTGMPFIIISSVLPVNAFIIIK